MSELYRIKVGKQRGGASWGDWEYYEDTEKLLIELLQHKLDVESDRRGKSWFEFMLSRCFSTRKDDEATTRNIYAVEKRVNDGWVEVGFEYQPPTVRLIFPGAPPN